MRWLNNMLLNNQWVSEEIKEEIKKDLKTSENGNVILKGKFIQSYLRHYRIPGRDHTHTENTYIHMYIEYKHI